jgi:hypothetical protein
MTFMSSRFVQSERDTTDQHVLDPLTMSLGQEGQEPVEVHT